MAKTIRQFSYDIKKIGKDDRPFNPIVTITLEQWSVGKDGTPTLSAHLMSEGEIDGEIDALKADLDAVGRRAKAALRRAQESTAKYVRDRKRSE